jgi:sulfur carrier protein
MMLIINGQERECASYNLAEVWREETSGTHLASAKGFAIALNGAVIRKDQWQNTSIADGDRIEIVRAMQGG